MLIAYPPGASRPAPFPSTAWDTPRTRIQEQVGALRRVVMTGVLPLASAEERSASTDKSVNRGAGAIDTVDDEDERGGDREAELPA